MKRILYVLVALFTFIGYQSNAQQITVNIGSGIGNIGDVVDIPVEVYLPAGSQGITAFQGAIVSSDPSTAEIVGFTLPTLPPLLGIAFDAFLINSGAVNFSGSSPQTPFNFPNNLMITLQVKIKALDCATLDLSNMVNASGGFIGPLQFVLDGVNGPILDDLASDFIVSNGQVCGSTQCGTPPTGLSCSLVLGKFTGYQTLSWTPMANVVSYEIEYAFNDPNCCAGVSGAPSRVRTDVGNVTSVNYAMNYECFSFRVRAKCEDGTVSDWSDPICSCGPVSTGPGNPGLSESITNPNVTLGGQMQLRTVPNPANDHVDISMTGSLFEDTPEDMELLIYDMSGKQVYTSGINLDETKRVDLSSFNSGMYIVNILSEGAVLSTEKLIVE